MKKSRLVQWIAVPLLCLAFSGLLLGCGAKKQAVTPPGAKMDPQKIINDPNTPEAVRQGLREDTSASPAGK